VQFSNISDDHDTGERCRESLERPIHRGIAEFYEPRKLWQDGAILGRKETPMAATRFISIRGWQARLVSAHNIGGSSSNDSTLKMWR
jgi:hypothetical protein